MCAQGWCALAAQVVLSGLSECCRRLRDAARNAAHIAMAKIQAPRTCNAPAAVCGMCQNGANTHQHTSVLQHRLRRPCVHTNMVQRLPPPFSCSWETLTACVAGHAPYGAALGGCA
jgi:hypothetical protein